MTRTAIERIGGIDPQRLSGEFYFNTLLAEAQQCLLLGEGDAARIQLGCFGLLRDKIEQYTRGESSSVPEETAKALLASVLYTISIHLKTLPTPEAAVALLINEDLPSLYRLGRKRLDTKLKAARMYYGKVVHGMVTTDNYAYNTTIIGGISGFFKLYNPELGADETHITADYPTCNPITDLVGIEFIQHYLGAIKLENDFCSLFPHKPMERLLHCYHPNSKDLIFNLFGQVLTSAIGCMLLHKDILTLRITAKYAAKLGASLSGLTRAQLTAIVTTAAWGVCGQLDLADTLLCGYITEALPELCADIEQGLAAGRAFVVTG